MKLLFLTIIHSCTIFAVSAFKCYDCATANLKGKNEWSRMVHKTLPLAYSDSCATAPWVVNSVVECHDWCFTYTLASDSTDYPQKTIRGCAESLFHDSVAFASEILESDITGSRCQGLTGGSAADNQEYYQITCLCRGNLCNDCVRYPHEHPTVVMSCNKVKTIIAIDSGTSSRYGENKSLVVLFLVTMLIANWFWE